MLAATNGRTADAVLRVEIDVNHVLDTCDAASLFRKGICINVVGYVESKKVEEAVSAPRDSQIISKRGRKAEPKLDIIRVRAIAVWGTGPSAITVEKFEAAVNVRQQASKLLAAARQAAQSQR